jgi:hypothetical protein
LFSAEPGGAVLYGILHGIGDAFDFGAVGLGGREHDDEKGKHQRDEIGIRNQPSIVIPGLILNAPAPHG